MLPKTKKRNFVPAQLARFLFNFQKSSYVLKHFKPSTYVEIKNEEKSTLAHAETKKNSFYYFAHVWICVQKTFHPNYHHIVARRLQLQKNCIFKALWTCKCPLHGFTSDNLVPLKTRPIFKIFQNQFGIFLILSTSNLQPLSSRATRSLNFSNRTTNG